MTTRRQERVAEQLRNVISKLLIEEGLHAPGIQGLITVTKVSITPDLKYAKVYVSNMNNPEAQETTIRTLNEEKATVRYTVGKELNLRYTPHIEFVLDVSLDLSERIDQLLKSDTKKK